MGRCTHLILPALGLALIAAPAGAEQRSFTVTSFERIIVSGPFTVQVTTGGGSSARAEGDYQAINRISLQVTGQTLTVRRNSSTSWGGPRGDGSGGSAVLYLSTNEIDQATLIGDGDVEIDRLAGQRMIATLGGNGRLAIGRIEGEEATLNVTGAGMLEAGGEADSVRITVQGAGSVVAPGLTVNRARVNLSGPGLVELTAEREAEIIASGRGSVRIHGDAACTDRSVGAGDIVCDGFAARR
ncbi:MAG: GIN domain-containing protein [Parasphingopyxis sp.]|nr:DUF2807 domain-containing protein [Sphingomonadales bacterium]